MVVPSGRLLVNRPLAALLSAVVFNACSADAPFEPAVDPMMARLLVAPGAIPAFGGVTFEGSRLVIHTIGVAPAAEPAARALFGANADLEIRARPAFGRGSEGLKSRAAAVLFSVEGGQSADYDEATGYVRLGVVRAEAVRSVMDALVATDLPVSEILIHVEPPVQLR